ncbi:MAG: matrixin family metalloprotease [Rhodoferax sp.]
MPATEGAAIENTSTPIRRRSTGQREIEGNRFTLRPVADMAAVLSGVEQSAHGVSGMVVGADGHTLVVSLPKANRGYYAGQGPAGDVLVLDLDTLKLDSGAIAPPIVAKSSHSNAVYSPQAVSATSDRNRYLLSSVNDYNHGLGTLRIERDGSGQPSSARIESLDLSQPNNLIQIDRTNISNAQSAVLVRFPPTPIGGSLTAKKVAQGGKLGIVQDPFGLKGKPRYLGATLPLDGYGIVNLSLSDDGKVLLGQLKGGFGVNILQSTQNPHYNQAWDTHELIKAALAQSENERLRKHIALPEGAEQLVHVPTGTDGWVAPPAGTVFDPETILIDVQGNMGDVLEVDLFEQIARKQLGLALKGDLSTAQKAEVDKWQAQRLDKSSLALGQGTDLKDYTSNASYYGFKLLTTGNKNAQGLAQLVGGYGQESTKDNGKFYAMANLTDTPAPEIASGQGGTKGDPRSDMERLRQGDKASEKSSRVTFKISIKNSEGKFEATDVIVHLQASDAEHGVFFGDRPLENPGYSKLNLNKDTLGKVAKEIARVDAARIEQRLKYFGYGVSQIGNQEIAVDGKISQDEENTLRFFREITENRSGYLQRTLSGRNGKSTTLTIAPYAVALNSADVNWLNAYNAPHWMTFAGRLKSDTLNGWSDHTGDKPYANTATSWVMDLMLAAQQHNQAQERGKSEDTKLWFKGGGVLGTRLNLGINEKYVSKNNQDRVHGKEKVLGVIPSKADNSIPNAAAYNVGAWSLANAKAVAAKLKNPTVDPKFTGKDENAVGQNRQNEALLDFLSVYAATQATGSDEANPNGSWSQLDLKYAKGEYKKALFGDGTQTGGLIDAKNVLVGGTAAPLGAAMTVESLARFMKSVPGVDYAAWIAPMQKAMEKFEITTPERIAAFLGQIYVESGGMAKTIEDVAYTSPKAAAGLFSVLGGEAATKTYYETLFDAGNPNNGLRREGQETDWYTKGSNWLPEQQEQFANRIYATVNGNNQPGDGWRFRGTGLKQLTGRGNVEKFADWVESMKNSTDPATMVLTAEWPTKAQIMTDPVTHIGKNKTMSAFSAAHFYFNNIGTTRVDALNALNPEAFKTVNLNEGKKDANGKPLKAAWEYDAYSREVSLRVGQDRKSFKPRYDAWQRVVINAFNTNSNSSTTGNSYESMQFVLNHLGFVSRNAIAHEGKFGVTLRPQTSIAIQSGVQQLMDEHVMPNGLDGIEGNARLQPEYLEKEMSLSDTPADHMYFSASPTVMQVAAQNSASERAVKVVECGVVAPRSGGVYSVSAFFDAFNSVWNKNGDLKTYPGPDLSTVSRVLSSPKHGQLDKQSASEFNYIPGEGFEGKDSFVIRVESAGRAPVVIHYKVMVFTSGADWGWEHDCKKPPFVPFSYRQSKEPGDPTPWLQSAQLSALLSAASTLPVSFAPLPGATLGQTLGVGEGAQITLDDNAAGHGWYIDPSPLDNSDDYLPTSDPNLWQAKPGSAADGKMDLLSVLLHELGHALGEEHSQHAGDYMATSLQSGQRKLPSAQEIEHLLALAAPLGASKQALAREERHSVAITSIASVEPPVPSTPSAPGTPWGGFGGLGGLAGWLATRRRSDTAPVMAQALQSVNPRLQTDTGLSGWSSSGTVQAQGADPGTSSRFILQENAASQTRLSQAFVVGEGDKVLSFRLSNISLDDVHNAPDDAFEVALLDLHTGQSLLGGTGLTHSDALYNLQADGREHRAAQVSTQRLADGSIQVVVDLGSVAVGTQAQLWLDLIGFGQGQAASSSQVTVSDLRLGAFLQAHDDAHGPNTLRI